MVDPAEGLVPDAFIKQLGDAWGWILLRGVASIAFGAMAILWPGLTIVVLVVMWAAWAFVDGITSLVTAYTARDGGKPIWPLVLNGVLGIAAGLITFFAPGVAAVTLLVFIAAWAIVTGVLEIVHAIRVRKSISNEWMLILSGVLSVVVGLYMLSSPAGGALAIIWVIAFWSILFGVLLCSAAFRLKKARDAKA
ncbi:MAG TPA: HdeD family acid-resistance protein [Casimicrobiaceae bacterium]|nr:HdeD family acid-resistance protein [Casimicrobiaceae bacterium]